MKKALFLVLAGLVAFNAYTAGKGDGATASKDEAVSLRFTTWTGNPDQLALLKSFADGFNASQDAYEVNVTFDTLPFQDYVQKVTLQLAGSNPPDMGWLVENSAPVFVKSGVLDDLSKELSQYDYPDFSPSSMKLWVNGKGVYGVPFSTSPFIIMYNKTLFNKAGIPTPQDLVKAGKWTWDSFRDSAKQITEKTGVYGFQTMDGQGYNARIWHTLVPIIRGYGSDAWDETGKVTINSPEAVRAVKLFHEMVYRDGSVVPPGDLSDFYAGAAAMTLGQISRVSKLAKVDWEWDIAPMPSGPAGMGSSETVGQAAMVVFASGKKRDAARALLAYMANKQNVTAMSRYWPPARQSVIGSSDFLAGNPDISEAQMKSAVAPGLQKGKVLSYHEKFPEISLAAAGEFDRLWKPDANIQEVMDAVAKAIKSQM